MYYVLCIIIMYIRTKQNKTKQNKTKQNKTKQFILQDKDI